MSNDNHRDDYQDCPIVVIGRSTLVDVIFGVSLLFGSSIIILYTFSSSFPSASLFKSDIIQILPIYYVVLTYTIVISLVMGIDSICSATSFIFGEDNNVYDRAFFWLLNLFCNFSVSIFLMHNAIGWRAIRNSFFIGLLFSFLSAVIPLCLYARYGYDEYCYAMIAVLTIITIFYFICWLSPLKYLHRRPALIHFSRFYVLFIVIFILVYMFSLDSLKDFFNISTCLNEMFFSILQFLHPYLILYAVHSDSLFWQGLYMNSSTSNINEPLLGMWELGRHTISVISDSVGELERKVVPIIPFGSLTLDVSRFFAGGSARVYKGNYLDNIVAIKILFLIDLTPESVVEFCNEATLLNSLKHDNVVACYGVAVLPPAVCLVVEFCEFGSLYDFLHRSDFVFEEVHDPDGECNESDLISASMQSQVSIANISKSRKSGNTNEASKKLQSKYYCRNRKFALRMRQTAGSAVSYSSSIHMKANSDGKTPDDDVPLHPMQGLLSKLYTLISGGIFRGVKKRKSAAIYYDQIYDGKDDQIFDDDENSENQVITKERISSTSVSSPKRSHSNQQKTDDEKLISPNLDFGQLYDVDNHSEPSENVTVTPPSDSHNRFLSKRIFNKNRKSDLEVHMEEGETSPLEWSHNQLSSQTNVSDKIVSFGNHIGSHGDHTSDTSIGASEHKLSQIFDHQPTSVNKNVTETVTDQQDPIQALSNKIQPHGSHSSHSWSHSDGRCKSCDEYRSRSIYTSSYHLSDNDDDVHIRSISYNPRHFSRRFYDMNSSNFTNSGGISSGGRDSLMNNSRGQHLQALCRLMQSSEMGYGLGPSNSNQGQLSNDSRRKRLSIGSSISSFITKSLRPRESSFSGTGGKIRTSAPSEASHKSSWLPSKRGSEESPDFPNTSTHSAANSTSNTASNANLKSKHKLPLALRYLLARDCCAGVAFLHSHGFIHCDIKSLNFLVTKDLVVKLSDLGEARHVMKQTDTADLPRNMNWSPPEVLLGNSYVMESSDVWSLAAVVSEILTGNIPFDEPEYRRLRLIDFVELLKNGLRPELNSSEIDDWVKNLLEHCWAYEPNARYSSTHMLATFEWQLGLALKAKNSSTNGI